MELGAQLASGEASSHFPASKEPSQRFVSTYGPLVTLAPRTLAFEQLSARQLELTARAILAARTLIRLHSAACTLACVLFVRVAAELIAPLLESDDATDDEGLGKRAARLLPQWVALGCVVLLSLLTSPSLLLRPQIVMVAARGVGPLLAFLTAAGGACLSLVHGPLYMGSERTEARLYEDVFGAVVLTVALLGFLELRTIVTQWALGACVSLFVAERWLVFVGLTLPWRDGSLSDDAFDAKTYMSATVALAVCAVLAATLSRRQELSVRHGLLSSRELSAARRMGSGLELQMMPAPVLVDVLKNNAARAILHPPAPPPSDAEPHAAAQHPDDAARRYAPAATVAPMLSRVVGGGGGGGDDGSGGDAPPELMRARAMPAPIEDAEHVAAQAVSLLSGKLDGVCVLVCRVEHFGYHRRAASGCGGSSPGGYSSCSSPGDSIFSGVSRVSSAASGASSAVNSCGAAGFEDEERVRERREAETASLLETLAELTAVAGVLVVQVTGHTLVAASGAPASLNQFASTALVCKLGLALVRCCDEARHDCWLGVATAEVASCMHIRSTTSHGPSLRYQLAGEAVETASALCRHGVAGGVHVSANTHGLVCGAFAAEERGAVEGADAVDLASAQPTMLLSATAETHRLDSSPLLRHESRKLKMSFNGGHGFDWGAGLSPTKESADAEREAREARAEAAEAAGRLEAQKARVEAPEASSPKTPKAGAAAAAAAATPATPATPATTAAALPPRPPGPTLADKVKRIATELGLDEDMPMFPTVQAAYETLGLTPSTSKMTAQVLELIDQLGIDFGDDGDNGGGGDGGDGGDAAGVVGGVGGSPAPLGAAPPPILPPPSPFPPSPPPSPSAPESPVKVQMTGDQLKARLQVADAFYRAAAEAASSRAAATHLDPAAAAAEGVRVARPAATLRGVAPTAAVWGGLGEHFASDAVEARHRALARARARPALGRATVGCLLLLLLELGLDLFATEDAAFAVGSRQQVAGLRFASACLLAPLALFPLSHKLWKLLPTQPAAVATFGAAGALLLGASLLKDPDTCSCTPEVLVLLALVASAGAALTSEAAALACGMLLCEWAVGAAVAAAATATARGYVVAAWRAAVLGACTALSLRQLRDAEAQRRLALAVGDAVATHEHQTRSLLLRLLPEPILRRLREGLPPRRRHERSTALSARIVGVGGLATRSTPASFGANFNLLVRQLDNVAHRHGLIACECVAGEYVAFSDADHHAERVAFAALDMNDAVARLNKEVEGLDLQLRIGVHSGGLTSGLTALERGRHSAWGDAIDGAEALRRSCPPGKLLVSMRTHEALASGPRRTHVAVVEAPPTVGIPGSAEEAPMGAVFAQRTTDFDFKHASRSPTKRGRKATTLSGTAASLSGGFGAAGRRAVSSNGLLIVTESDASDPSTTPSPVKPARPSMGAPPPPPPSF